MVVSSDLGRWFSATDGVELGVRHPLDGKCPPATAFQAFMSSADIIISGSRPW